jgi:AP-3 complex subunit mu
VFGEELENFHGHRRLDHHRQHRVKTSPYVFDLSYWSLTRRPIIQSGFRSANAAYPLLHVDALNNALAKAAPRPSDVNAVLHVPAYDATRGPSACCHISHGDVRILCPISGNGASLSLSLSPPHLSSQTLFGLQVDPLLAFAFLQTFVDVLREYFGSVSAETLKGNFDTVYQVSITPHPPPPSLL